MHADEAYVVEALRLGASAFVLKESTSEELLEAIRNVSSGGRYLSPPLSDRAIDAYIRRAEEQPLDEAVGLTLREREVLHLAVEGLTSAEIASRLVISPRTVETHRGNLMKKLGLHSQADLVRYALQRGLLPMIGRTSDDPEQPV
jgi:two-component system, NarL family, response regulator NreC